MDPSIAAALPVFLPAPDVVAEFRITDDWDGGYAGEVTVRNTRSRAVDTWSLRLEIPDGFQILETWDAVVTPADRAYRATPAGWNGRIAPGGTARFGLVVQERSGPRMVLDRTPLHAPAALAPAPEAQSRFAPALVGFNMASWWTGTFAEPGTETALADMAVHGANVVAVVPTHYVASHDSAEIFANEQTESDENVIAMMRKARALGLKVVLKPHVHVADFSLHHLIEPTDSRRFFEDFQALMEHYARMAEAEHADMFILTGELVSLTKPRYEADWRRVIAAVRQIYGGPITYAANWGEELQVPFWDALDVIAIDMYAPLTRGDDPTVEEVVAGWLEPPVNGVVRDLYDGLPLAEAMRRLSQYHGKPILFAEIGYRSIDGAGTGKMDDAEGARDFTEQAVLYEGLARAMAQTGAGWLDGLLFWVWPTAPAVAGAPVPDPDGFGVSGKPAAEVFTTHFAPERAP